MVRCRFLCNVHGTEPGTGSFLARVSEYISTISSGFKYCINKYNENESVDAVVVEFSSMKVSYVFVLFFSKPLVWNSYDSWWHLN